MLALLVTCIAIALEDLQIGHNRALLRTQPQDTVAHLAKLLHPTGPLCYTIQCTHTLKVYLKIFISVQGNKAGTEEGVLHCPHSLSQCACAHMISCRTAISPEEAGEEA